MNQKKAVILLSGGLDSATVVAMAKADGYACYTMSFDYGQRHRAELQAAERVARQLGVIEHKVIGLDLNGMGGSALTDESIAVPESPSEGIPVTYVPARNTVFLSLALGWAEVLDARDIFIGVNAVDYLVIWIVALSSSRLSNAWRIWQPRRAWKAMASASRRRCSICPRRRSSRRAWRVGWITA